MYIQARNGEFSLSDHESNGVVRLNAPTVREDGMSVLVEEL